MTSANTTRALRYALGASGLWLAACNSEPAVELREWRASDHQPPPAVAPEGQGAGQDDGVAPERRAAVALWGMRCASCHGAEGRGDGAGRPPGAAVPDMMQEAFHASRADTQLLSVITQGKGLMPAFRTELTEQGILALVGHIRTLRPVAAPAQP